VVFIFLILRELFFPENFLRIRLVNCSFKKKLSRGAFSLLFYFFFQNLSFSVFPEISSHKKINPSSFSKTTFSPIFSNFISCFHSKHFFFKYLHFLHLARFEEKIFVEIKESFSSIKLPLH